MSVMCAHTHTLPAAFRAAALHPRIRWFGADTGWIDGRIAIVCVCGLDIGIDDATFRTAVLPTYQVCAYLTVHKRTLAQNSRQPAHRFGRRRIGRWCRV